MIILRADSTKKCRSKRENRECGGVVGYIDSISVRGNVLIYLERNSATRS